MKALFFSCCLVVTLTMLGQDKKYPVPDFVGKPVHYNDSANSMNDLERQVALSVTKNKLISINSYFYIAGAKSDVRIKQNNVLTFLFRADNPEKELELQMRLYVWQPNTKNNTREMETSRATVISVKGIEKKLTYKYKKVGDNLWLVNLENLPVGEYSFSTKDATYAFGID